MNNKIIIFIYLNKLSLIWEKIIIFIVIYYNLRGYSFVENMIKMVYV